MFEKHGDKGALPGLQLLTAPIDRAFDEGGGRQCVRCWLTDKTQTLSFSGCFLVLKHKTRLATLSILLLRGHRWFRIRCATEVHRRDQLVALRESIVHPM